MTRRPIRQKLILISMCTTSAPVLLACVLFLAYDYVAVRDPALHSLDTLTTSVGAGSTAALGVTRACRAACSSRPGTTSPSPRTDARR